MTDEPIYVSKKEDMARFDALPRSLRDFINELPIGFDATIIAELYEDKISAAYEEWEAVKEVKNALLHVIRLKFKVTETRPLKRRPGTRKRRM